MAATHPGWSGGAPHEPLSRVELHISCKNLPNMDTFSKSDPMAVVYLASGGSWVEYDRTETINDNLSPAFVKAINVDYFFETTQHIRIAVYDVDDASGGLAQQDFLGSFDTTVAAVMGGRGQRVTGQMKDARGGSMAATMTVSGEEVTEMKLELQLQLAARNLDKKDLFGKSDPFFEVCKARTGATAENTADAAMWVPVIRSNVVKKNLNPTWAPIHVPVSKLVGSDIERRILLRIYDWNKKSEPDLIGEVSTTISQLESAGVNDGFEVIHPKKRRKKKKYRNSGVLMVTSFALIEKPSFLDYVVGGCDISLSVGIDFTASNGNPATPASLHYISPYEPNQYVRAITSVGEVLANYDSDQRFAALGYGAKVPPGNQVSHCFPLTLDPNQVEVVGVEGIVHAYYHALHHVSLYGPTNFAPIIRAAAAQAGRHATQETQEYMLLLIITDGIISDMDATTAAIVEASSLPMSIIIVGVGDADFDSMELLDGDDVRLSHNGVFAERDIVQFVPFREFGSAHPEMLARETLAELPSQFLSYMTKHGIKPNPPLAAPAPSYGSVSSYGSAGSSAAAGLPAYGAMPMAATPAYPSAAPQPSYGSQPATATHGAPPPTYAP
ncbi:copine III [Thecamonas trahens ATCC 50062]|uniref:Copine-3 n=1 Tax=Thecamonas trahens ATCC 50062 TaxID=461836 RepID=A0A0L0D6L0_THETB|nr:copine III [Thecamonas trahens ATCC 50062]KNC46943.1 copine III [Thecamonas trahens ATCC 50062]|eukprot:XP_013760215.1 copine III [Thecamonas trahens ATCC 50062]